MVEAVQGRVGSVSLHNRRVTFPPAAHAAGRPPDIAPLTFLAKFEGGRSHRVDLRTFPLPAMASEFARLLLQGCEPTGHYKSPGTVSTAVQGLKRFGEMVVSRGWTDRIRRVADITGPDIDAFEDYLYERHGPQSRVPYVRLGAVIRVIRLALEAGLAHERVGDRLRFVSRRGLAGINRPREPYSPFVAEQLRRAAAADIQAAVLRLTTAGPALLTEGQDPAVAGWREPANLLWAMAHAGLTTGCDAPPHVVHGLRSYRAYSGTEFTFSALLRHVHLVLEDALAFMIFLSLETGLPIESVTGLRTDCLQNEARGYADLRYVKRRSGTGHRQVRRVRADGEFSPGGLIRTLAAVTARTREQMAPAERDWLFVGHGRADWAKRGHLRRLEPNNEACVRFCERHAITGDDGQRLMTVTLSRLRKTYKAERYSSAPELAASDGDHTRAVHDAHYANVAALRPIHERTVAQALEQALGVAMAPFVVPTSPGGRPNAPDEAACRRAGLTPAQAATVAHEASDVWLASCLDHVNSPLQPPGSGTCRSPVWGCLGCGNAVITAAKLPAILAFLAHIVERRSCMDLQVWLARYGEAYGRIVANILPRFPPADISAAQAAAIEGDLMWLPATLIHSP